MSRLVQKKIYKIASTWSDTLDLKYYKTKAHMIDSPVIISDLYTVFWTLVLQDKSDIITFQNYVIS